MTLTDILTIGAILLAPLAALEVQRLVDEHREKNRRRLAVFKTLMGTRAAIVSPDHVQALNMIDLEFAEAEFKGVTDAWKTYLDHLNSYPTDDLSRQVWWGERRTELLTKLLSAMGGSLGYNFDEVHLKRGIYSPIAHGQIEDQNFRIRLGLIDLLRGQTSLKMDVTSFPPGDQGPPTVED